MRKIVLLFALCMLCSLLPELSMAATGGISQLVTGPEKVMQTITGPLGRIVAIIAMSCCGVMFVYNKDDLSGGVKLLLSVVFGISFIVLSTAIVDGIFGLSGALV